MICYTVFNIDGSIVEKESEESTLLEELQKEVGGFLEVVSNHPQGVRGWLLLVNEDGIRLGLKKNPFWLGLLGVVVLIHEKDFK